MQITLIHKATKEVVVFKNKKELRNFVLGYWRNLETNTEAEYYALEGVFDGKTTIDDMINILLTDYKAKKGRF